MNSNNANNNNITIINVIVFSKDRPFQLNEYLRTLYKYSKLKSNNNKDSLKDSLNNNNNNNNNDDDDLILSITVIYHANNKIINTSTNNDNYCWNDPTFLDTYGCLIQKYPQINFINETIDSVTKKSNFNILFKNTVDSIYINTCARGNKDSFILFGVDDVIFYNTIDFITAVKILKAKFQIKKTQSAAALIIDDDDGGNNNYNNGDIDNINFNNIDFDEIDDTNFDEIDDGNNDNEIIENNYIKMF